MCCTDKNDKVEWLEFVLEEYKSSVSMIKKPKNDGNHCLSLALCAGRLRNHSKSQQSFKPYYV